MDVIMKYYNVNRILLLIVGLWPYQKSTCNKIHVVCMFVIFVQPIIFQLMKFITTEFSVLLFLEIISTLFIEIVFVFKYCTIYFSMDQIKLFLGCIKDDWDSLKDSMEIEIMRKQANIARWYTKYFALTMFIITTLFVTTHYVPVVLDAIIPLAEPRSRRVLIVGEMFIDQHKYFHVVMLDITVTAFLGMTTVVAAETMLMLLIQHACGLLKVTSYQITRAFDNDCIQDLTCGTKCTVCIKLASAVKMHRSAIMFSDRIRHCFIIPYIILISVGVASLSINLYRLSLMIAMAHKIEAFITCAFICGHFLYMFWCNYAGQELINYNDEIYRQTYNAQWYASFVHDQKMLILILCKSAKPLIFGVSNLFVISLEFFGTMVSMSLSYFTVIYSTR